MSNRRSVCIIVVLLVFSISIYGLPQSSAPYASTQAAQQASSIQRQSGPPETSTKLIREYLLPEIPPATLAYLGPRRGPCGIVYDNTGNISVTDFNRDAIYRLKPATILNQTTTSALEWLLPNTQGHGKRYPYYIIANDTGKVLWFTNPVSQQISRLNWETNRLDDWNLANFNVMPLDLVMVGGSIWFTGLNETRFFRLDVSTNLVQAFQFNIPAAGTPGVPARPTRIATNGTSLYMTDWKYDKLYEVPLPQIGPGPFPTLNVLIYSLQSNGFSWDVDNDISKNVWVTQPLSCLINEQLANSHNKSSSITSKSYDQYTSRDNRTLARTPISVSIEVTPVTPSASFSFVKKVDDPLVVWNVTTGVTVVGAVSRPARPWDIATSSNGFAWFTEPINNHVGVVQPDANTTVFYAVPTAASWPLCIDIQPGQGSNPYHVWFTEYLGGNIGEILNDTYTDVRVCPSLSAQYPPPNPGSIRWTPGVEIWIDAPSNGYDPAHHDSGERGVTNHLYARVKNMGSSSLSSISVKFYWYHNTSVPLASNYIPLPPFAPSTQRWTSIGSTTIASLAAGSTADVYVDWNIGSNMPTYVTVGVQVSVGSDSNLYDNIGYCNFTLTSPTAPPTFTPAGIGLGFAAGFGVMLLIALVLLRKRK